MTVLLRSLIVWLMLLALPYQGYASATMLLCAAPATVATAGSSAPAAMSAAPHDHAAMMAAQSHKDHAGKSTHSGMKCGGTACCATAAPALSATEGMPLLPLVSVTIPFYSDFLPAVDLAHPERPPQDQRA